MTPTGSTIDPIAWPPDPVERAAAAAAAGLRTPVPPEMPSALAGLVAGDADPRVRAAALGALARLLDPPPDAWWQAAADPDASVRRRAAEVAPAFAGRGGAGSSEEARDSGAADGDRDAGADVATGGGAVDVDGAGTVAAADRSGVARRLLSLLTDPDAAVAEAAAWALGEAGAASVAAGAVEALAATARSNGDPLVREAAVAALGALGDPGGLDAVLSACADKPTIRRRAVLALAAFDGPEVDAALRAALADKDWQTRQAAEDLLASEGDGGAQP